MGNRIEGRDDGTFSLARSKTFRIDIQHPNHMSSYEASLSAPHLEPTGKQIDLQAKLESDGNSYDDITRDLSLWARSQAEHVDKVTLSCHSRGYSLAILLLDLSEEIVAEIYANAEIVRKWFRGREPTVYVLGPEQRDSDLFKGAGSYVA